MKLRFARQAPPALRRLAARVHALTEQLLRTADDAPGYDEDLDWAAAQIEGIQRRLEPHTRDAAIDRGRPYYVSGVLVGEHHPMYMPIELETADGVTRGRVNLDIAWEGPPGHVHGGYVAHLFDTIMGQHNLNLGVPGMTASLTVRYLEPTPLHVDLCFVVATTSRTERKIQTKAVLRANDDVIGEAEGLFIIPESFSVPPSR